MKAQGSNLQFFAPKNNMHTPHNGSDFLKLRTIKTHHAFTRFFLSHIPAETKRPAMNSAELYNHIYDTNEKALRSGDVLIDPVLSRGMKDRRFGLSLIIPVRRIQIKYEKLVRQFKEIEPLYYYPFSDLHITIFDFVQGSGQYRRNQETEMKCIEAAEKALKGVPEFDIEFDGIVFSREAGLLQGFDHNRLLQIRKCIRKVIKEIGLKNDERYESGSAHITFCRFKEKIRNPETFMHFVDEKRKYKLGKEKIDLIQLVEHDWYNQESKKRVIQCFSIGRSSSLSIFKKR